LKYEISKNYFSGSRDEKLRRIDMTKLVVDFCILWTRVKIESFPLRKHRALPLERPVADCCSCLVWQSY